MDNDLQNAIEESLPQQTQADPSPAHSDTQDSQPVAPVETPTPKVEQEKPFHENPRFKEVIDQKNLALQQAEYWRQQAEHAMGLAKSAQPVPQPVDPYANVSSDEREGIRKVAEIARREALAVASEKEVILSKELQEQKVMTQALIYRDFQNRHPDVIPNSPEENRIAEFYRQGIPLDTAYETVFAPIKAQRAIEEERKKYTTKTQQKVQANLETASVAPSNGIPTKTKTDFRSFVASKGKEMGVPGF